MRFLGAGLALVMLCAQAWAVPSIQHEPVTVAQKGRALGIRATVTDASVRVSSVALYYAISKGSTPFRSEMTSSGAGQWFGTIPGHLVGPGEQLFYYLQAENADGETSETGWQTVRVLAATAAPAVTPSAADLATQKQATALPKVDPSAQRGVGTGTSHEPKIDNSKKYWIAAGIIAGGAVAVGGALALSDSGGGHHSGGNTPSGGGSTTVTNGNFGGSYNLCFEAPSATTTTSTTNSTVATSSSDCRNGNANVYVDGSSVEIVGIWGSEVLTGTLSGNVFSAAKSVPESGSFPSAYLSVSGSFSGSSSCSMSISGTSSEASRPGAFSGSFSGTRR